jgi:hypothetical protein
VALRLDRTRISGAVDLRKASGVEGAVPILSASIGTDLDLGGVIPLTGAGGTLEIGGTEIKGSFKLKTVLSLSVVERLRKSPNTVVAVTDTSCAVLSDDLERWPAWGQPPR